jgi:hypothetical protein
MLASKTANCGNRRTLTLKLTMPRTSLAGHPVILTKPISRLAEEICPTGGDAR